MSELFRKDYIQLGDCLYLMQDIPDESIDMILCDPPYGTSASKWDSVLSFDKMWEQYKRIIKKNGAIAMFGSEPFSTKLRMSNLQMYKYDWIWDKGRGTVFLDAKFRPLKQHEIVSIFSYGGCANCSKIPMKYRPQGLKKLEKPGTYARSNSDIFRLKIKQDNLELEDDRNKNNDVYGNYPTSILKYKKDGVNGKLHPTQKPILLLEYLIRTYTDENDVVLDSCMGSGSTCVASVNTGRHYIGFEKDSAYYEIANKRIEEAKRGVKQI